jgi:hypothetical protein
MIAVDGASSGMSGPVDVAEDTQVTRVTDGRQVESHELLVDPSEARALLVGLAASLTTSTYE